MTYDADIAHWVDFFEDADVKAIPVTIWGRLSHMLVNAIDDYHVFNEATRKSFQQLCKALAVHEEGVAKQEGRRTQAWETLIQEGRESLLKSLALDEEKNAPERHIDGKEETSS